MTTTTTTTSTTTITTEIAPGIHRISSYLPDGPPGGITFNQFLIVDDETMLFHTGTRRLFPSTLEVVRGITDPVNLRWISSCHVSRPDEYGALSEWEAVAPHAQTAHGQAGCFLCLSDMSDRQPRFLGDGEVLELGTHRMRWIDTPHVPGPWEAGVLFDEGTSTLFCGDLFARSGPTEATTTDEIVAAAIAHDQLMHGHAYTPNTGATLRRLAGLEPQILALMHGPTFFGDGGSQLRGMADYLDSCLVA